MPGSSSPQDRRSLDPVLKSARRETYVLLATFALFALWAVGWSYLFGYHRPTGEPVPTTFGIPSWVFWGILIPWLAADVFTVWFCFVFMTDVPLGDAEDEQAEANAEKGAKP